MTKKITGIILIFCIAAMTLSAFPAFVAADDSASGTCGDDLTWSFNSETGELSIVGSGDMYNWYSVRNVPWYSYRTYITSVTINGEVTAIGYNAFNGCSKLTQITLPETILLISSDAFYGCTALTEVSLPNVMTRIGVSAFLGCSSLTRIVLPNTLTEIYSMTFSGCSSLSEITIPESVMYIDSSAFSGCTSLTEITIPESVTYIESSAFSGCTSLNEITLPESYVDMGQNVFYNTAYYNNADNWDGDYLYMADYLITVNSSLSGEYSVKDGTLYIGGYAFYNHSALTSVTLPNSVQIIGNCAFCRCTGLTSMTVPEGVTRIRESAFSGCTNLTSIDLPDTLVAISDGAFTSSGLTEITIPNGVLIIEDTAFSKCTGLVDISLPDSIMNLGYHAFYQTGYYNDESYWEDGVLYVGKYLTDADSSVIGSAYSIKDGTLLIAPYAFEDCEQLVDITIPKSVRTVCYHAFLRTGYYNDASNWEDHVLYLGNHLLSCEYEEGAEEVLSSVSGSYTVKDGTVCIAGCALRYSGNLTSITIPSSVTNIGQYAFEGCTSLTDVYYTGSAEEWAEVYIDTYNEPLLNATIHYDYEPSDESVALTVIGKYSQSVDASILRESDSVTLTVNISDTDALTADQVRAFAASYNDNTASVLELDKTVSASDTIIFTGNIDENCKIFIWDENMHPITEAAE